MSDRPAVQALAPQRHRPVHRHGGDGRRQRPRRDAAPTCCTSRSASPAAARRRRRSRRPPRRWPTAAAATPRPSACRPCAGDRPALPRGPWGQRVDPARIAMTVGASGAFILAFLAAFDAGDRVIVTEPGYPAYRNILQALGVEVVALPTDVVDPLPADAGAARAGARADRRPDPGQPVQPDRHHAAARRARSGSPPTARGAASASSRTRSTTASPTTSRPRPSSPSRRDAIVVNSFSKYLRHDRLAPRLAGAAAGAGRARDPAGAEPVHLRAGRRAARRPRRHGATCPSWSGGSSATAATARTCCARCPRSA